MPRRCLHGVHPLLHHPSAAASFFASALPARGASPRLESRSTSITLCLGAACTGCIAAGFAKASTKFSLPRRCLHGVHHRAAYLPAKGSPLPRRCLHGVHLGCAVVALYAVHFASALPARGASPPRCTRLRCLALCLGAACTGCIGKSRQIAAHHFVAYAVSR